MLPECTILCGDALAELAKLPAESVHCCVTSPPYWGLRDYGVDGQMGLEKTPEEYVAKMVAVFQEVRRVLRDDGTMFLNIGDSYWGGGNYRGLNSENTLSSKQASNRGATGICQELGAVGKKTSWGLKPKDLCGISWRLAFALQSDGWWLRQDIIWHKPNPMPESVTDRPTKSHEYLFLLSKAERYFYDAEAIKEPAGGWNGSSFTDERDALTKPNLGQGPRVETATRNKRSVWTIPSFAFSGAHFATFPPDLIKPCILAGTSARGCCLKCGAGWERQIEIQDPNGRLGKTYQDHTADLTKGHRNAKPSEGRPVTITTGWRPTCDCGLTETVPCTVLDPFAGSGTTGKVSLELGRNAILIELNPAYVKLIEGRCRVTPGLPL